MRRLLLLSLASLALFASLALPARACLWDSETFRQEQEFKSNYQNQPGAPSESQGGSGYLVQTLTVSGVGVGLLAGGLVLGLTRVRRRD